MTTDKTTALAEIIRGIIAKHGGFEPHKHEQHVMNYVAQIMETIAAFEQPLPSPTKYTDGTYSREYDEQPAVREMTVDKVADLLRDEGMQADEYNLKQAKALAKLGTIRVVEG